MDSPERNLTISSAEAEGSPLFDFISTLSPIKPVKSAHTAQTFSEISFPPVVFVSPKADAEKGSRSQQRIQSKCPAEEVASLSEVRRLNLQTIGGRVFAMMRKRTHKYTTETMVTSPCGSPSKLFEDYLSGPIEDEEETRINSSLVNSEGTGNATNADDGFVECNSSVKLEWVNSASTTNEREKDCLTTREQCKAETMDRTDTVLPVRTSQGNEYDSPDFEFLISEVEEGLHTQKFLDNWQTQAGSSTLSELSVEQVDSYIACLREVVDGGNQGTESETTYKCMGNGESEGHSKKQDFNASKVTIPFQRGARRRCLGFEISDNHVHSKAGTSGLVPISHAQAENVVGAKSVKVRLSSSKLVAQIGGSAHTSPVSASMPTGIGLHLNSLAEGSFRRGIVVSVVEKPKTGDSELSSKDESEKVVDSSLPSRLDSKPSPLGRKRVLLSELTHAIDSQKQDECSRNPQSPKKKRRLSSASEKSGDGCKRCNCKKSKCLKLYCECFAAGVYCVDSCSCQGCFNKPEFEETVMETRQQIESRNPLAFAPKIVRASESSPSNTDDCHDTPASARHKRGCNCKKSHCLKKYCECYQAGVGCSDGCRCESCKNVYGKKEGAEDSEENTIQVEAKQKEVDEQIHTSDCNDELVYGYDQNNEISPVTPFESTGQSRITIKSRSANRRCFSSEELHTPPFTLSSSIKQQSRSPSRLLRPAKEPQNGSPTVSSSLPKVGSTLISTPRIMRIGQFSPRWDGLSDICTLTPLPQAPLRRPVALASALDRGDSSPSIKTQQSSGSLITQTNYTNQLSSPSHSQSAPSTVQSQTPARIKGTPVTPLLTSSCTIETKIESSLAESDLIVQFIGADDDQTPEFLRDQEHGGCSPVRFLNSNSPKHKRVSPPHHHAPTKGQLQTTNMTTRRKFILQSIPSLPPTPAPAVHDEATIGSRSYRNET